MASKKSKRKTLSSLLWESLREEWGVWLAIAILVLITLLLSNQLATWLEKSAFIKLLDSLSKLGLLVAVIAFLREIPKWEERAEEEAKRRQFEYWKTIDSAKSASEASPDGRFTSYALRMALENLAKERDSSGQPLKIHNVDFSGADLHEINLANADLELSQFRYTNLSEADLRRAKLCKATFARARLCGTDFSEADLTAAAFRDAFYDNATKFPKGFNPKTMGMYEIIPGAFLSEAELAYAMLWEVDLEKADLRSANLTGAILGSTNLREANLQEACLRKVRAANINFQSASLCNADLKEANLYQAQFNNADLQGANFQGARIQGADFRGARNINQRQIKAAENWEQSTYDDDFCKELGLL